MLLAALLVALLAATWVTAPPVEPVLPGGTTDEESPPSPSRAAGAGGEATVPSLPVEWQAMSCELHLAKVGFGGVQAACQAPHHHHHGIHRHHRHHQTPEEKRLACCPVLATWLYAAQVEDHDDDESPSASSASAAGGISSSSAASSSSSQVEMPVPPDDSAVCAAQLEQGLHNRGLDFSPLNASCDFSLCFCGIRLRQMASLSCGSGAATLFHPSNRHNASASPLLRRILAACSDSSQSGCTHCIAALDDSMQWSESKQEALPSTSFKRAAAASSSDRGKSERMDCRFTGLMWLLGYNRTRYIPTVSSVVRALLYNADGQCSPDESKLPLADDASRTIQLYTSVSAASSSRSTILLQQLQLLLLLLLLLMSSIPLTNAWA